VIWLGDPLELLKLQAQPVVAERRSRFLQLSRFFGSLIRNFWQETSNLREIIV
jgi:hypothetical protein